MTLLRHSLVRVAATGVTLAALQLAPRAFAATDYAAWSSDNPRGAWTRITESAVRKTGLAQQVPKDIERLCPNYAALTENERSQFWVALLSVIARQASAFDPTATSESYLTTSSRHIKVGRGLLQLSSEAPSDARSICWTGTEELYDPGTNLVCGVMILAHWVQKDGVVASSNADRLRGGGRAWPTLRAWTPAFRDAAAFTNRMAVCQP